MLRRLGQDQCGLKKNSSLEKRFTSSASGSKSISQQRTGVGMTNFGGFELFPETGNAISRATQPESIQRAAPMPGFNVQP
jgi:hypothetical protein